MTTRLPPKDVVVIGLGWTGSILSYELAKSGLSVVAIERGPWRDTATDFNIGTAPDELRYGIRNELFLRPKQESITMRNNPRNRRCRSANGAASCRGTGSAAQACTGTGRPGASCRTISASVPT